MDNNEHIRDNNIRYTAEAGWHVKCSCGRVFHGEWSDEAGERINAHVANPDGADEELTASEALAAWHSYWRAPAAEKPLTFTLTIELTPDTTGDDLSRVIQEAADYFNDSGAVDSRESGTVEAATGVGSLRGSWGVK